jgi:hypothetical protein
MRKYTVVALITICFFYCSNTYSQQASTPSPPPPPPSWNQFNTAYGYIKLGPSNGSWAHIYTDVNNFIFNKDIYTLSGFGFSSYTNLNGSGNVGIGTINPTEKLEVEGNSIINGDLTLNDGSLFLNNTTINPWGTALRITVHNDNTRALTVKSSSGQVMFNV